MTDHDFNWFLDRLETARVISGPPGIRDVMTNCPAHGGSDSLHVTELPDGGAKLYCFAQQCTREDIVEALEEPESGDTADVPEAHQPAVRRVHRVRPPAEASVDAPADPMAWYSDYCGIPRDQIEALGVDAQGGWIRHYWDGLGIFKMREAAGPKRKWEPSGSHPPLLWPHAQLFPLPREVWLCEGETDCIVLRCGYGLPAYTAGSATTLPEEAELQILREMGVDSVVVAYDNDREGRKARKKVVESARAAGLIVSVAEPGHAVLGGPKDWRERWTLNPDPADVPLKGEAGSSVELWTLDELEPSKDQPLLLGRIDPDDHTILFGDGGSGKGIVAAWWVSCLTAGRGIDLKPSGIEPLRVLVLDYESHARNEWRKRIDAFHGDLTRVLIVQPSSPIWDVAAAVREIVVREGVQLVVVDSALYACADSGVDAYKPEGATRYSMAIKQWPCPTLTLAHRTKSREEEQFPFGTVFWHNGARLTISILADGEEEPHVVRTVKANHGDSFTVEIPWDWVRTGLPSHLEEHDAAVSHRDLIYSLIPADGSVVTKHDVELELRAQGAEVRGNIVSTTLGRMKRDGMVENVGRAGWRRTHAVKTGART